MSSTHAANGDDFRSATDDDTRDAPDRETGPAGLSGSVADLPSGGTGRLPREAAPAATNCRLFRAIAQILCLRGGPAAGCSVHLLLPSHAGRPVPLMRSQFDANCSEICGLIR